MYGCSLTPPPPAPSDGGIDASVPDANAPDAEAPDAPGGIDAFAPDANAADADEPPDGGSGLDAETADDAGPGDIGSVFPTCPAGQGRLRGVCVSEVNGCWPFYLHYTPGIPTELYPASGTPMTPDSTDTSSSAYYAAYGLGETRRDGQCTIALPTRGPDATDLCIVETINGFSECAALPTNPNVTGGIHRTFGQADPLPVPAGLDGGVDAGGVDAGEADIGTITSSTSTTADAGPPD